MILLILPSGGDPAATPDQVRLFAKTLPVALASVWAFFTVLTMVVFGCTSAWEGEDRVQTEATEDFRGSFRACFAAWLVGTSICLMAGGISALRGFDYGESLYSTLIPGGIITLWVAFTVWLALGFCTCKIMERDRVRLEARGKQQVKRIYLS